MKIKIMCANIQKFDFSLIFRPKIKNAVFDIKKGNSPTEVPGDPPIGRFLQKN